MFDESLPARLEEGELVVLPTTPFPLPCDADRVFLLEQRLDGAKEILFDPRSAKASGFHHQSRDQAERLHLLLASAYAAARDWLTRELPRYAARWLPDVARLHIEEEVTRRVRFMARNDLLHIDALFSRPTHQGRILRLFVNLHTTDPRVWATSEKVGRLLEMYEAAARSGGEKPDTWLERCVLRLFRPDKPALSDYDMFLNRFHRFLKKSDHFQESSKRHIWQFPPGSAWILFTDGLSHAELRGRGVLDCTFLVGPESLVRPELSPASLFQRRITSAARAA